MSGTTRFVTFVRSAVRGFERICNGCLCKLTRVPLRTTLDDALDAATQTLPGVVACVTSPTQILYEGARGVRSTSAEGEMTIDTIVALASMTKPLVSVAAMQLIERRELALDQPLDTVVPQLASPSVLEGFDDGGSPILRPARGTITVRQLLSHTSGYGYAFWNEDLCRLLDSRGTGVVPANWEELEATPLLFDPGAAWAYGISTDVLGKVIEAVSGVALDEYLTANVLGPMGMHDTTITLSDEQRARAASIHVRGSGGALEPLEDPIDGDRRFAMGGGSLCGTGPDYVRFLQMLLGYGTLDGERILEPASVVAMAADQLGPLPVTILRTSMPSASNDVDLLPGVPLTWGLGFQINTEPTSTGRCRGSLAWAGLFNTYFWVDHALSVGGVVLTQLLPFADETALGLLDRVERATYSSL